MLLVQYLGFIPSIPGGKESFVTSSAINNYVRLKIMPAPVKRKYYRVHIAYLIMILTMKQSISISDVQKILPADSSEDCVRSVYEAYSEKFRQLALFFNQQVQSAATDIRTPSGNEEGAVGAAGHRVRTHRRVLQNSGGEADPPVRRRYGGRSGRRAAPGVTPSPPPPPPRRRRQRSVCALMQGNPLFYRYHPPQPTPESIRTDMTALPPGKAMEDKWFVGFYDGDCLIAVMDPILNYPAADTAFIGLFMTAHDRQGCGLGSRILRDCIARLAAAGYHRLRLAVDEGNPQSLAFWTKNGFVLTGEVHPP